MKVNRTYMIYGAAALLVTAALAYSAVKKGHTPETVHVPQTPVTPPTPSANPTPFGTAGATLKMSARLSHSHLADGGAQPAWLLVDVDAIDKFDAGTVPLDVAVVIDRSGSMTGDKIESARRAARTLISKLRPGDRAALVTYSTSVTIEVPLTGIDASSAQSFYRAIDRLLAVGGTNISEGLSTGQRLLAAHPSDGRRVRRIILLSDGHATAGLTEVSQLARLAANARNSGISITSMGLGLDYNERAMTEIARQGGGNYYFIADSHQLAATFDKELGTLTASVVRDAELTLQVAAGVRVLKVHGFAHRIEGNTVKIPMSEFSAGQRKSMLVDLEVAGAPTGLTDVARLDLAYTDLINHKPARFDLGLSMATTTDASVVEAGRDRNVFVRREQILTANAYEDAMQRFEKGDKDGAQKILRGRNTDMLNNNKWLGSSKLDDEAADSLKALEALGYIDNASPAGKRAIKANRARSNKLLMVD